jgi:hypothetical protein
MARRISANIQGLDEVLQQLGVEGARQLEQELENIVEANAVRIANEAKENAPILDGNLKRSIHLYGRPAKLARTIGSNMPYAQRQEYEHATKKGYFRKALWNGREPFRREIREAIQRLDD